MTADDEVLEVGGRLAEPPAPALVRTAFATDLDSQRALGPTLGLADLAHTVMLIEGGTLPAGEGRDLLAALLALQEEPRDFAPDPVRGDLYTNREAWLSAHTSAAAWLGAGRARREATTVAWHLLVRRRLVDLVSALADTAEGLAAAAARHRQDLMPDQTYLQAAQPTTFGHYLLGFAWPMLRDLDRARALFDRIDRSPAGCGSSNGSRIPQDRARLAELLGFRDVLPHARDAMWQADAPVEALAVLVAVGVNLDRLAEDLMVFSTAEFGFVDLSDAYARASKVMPQKKNPFALAWLRGLANRLIGLQTAMSAAGRTPTGQVDNRWQPYADVPAALALVRDGVALAGAVVAGLVFRPGAARAALDRGFAGATDLAEALVEQGVGFRDAHRVVGRLARRLAESGRPAADLEPGDLAAASEEVLGRALVLDPEVLADALDPARAVARRTCVGGAAPDRVGEMATAIRHVLGPHREWAASTRERLDTAKRALLERAASLAGGA